MKGKKFFSKIFVLLISGLGFSFMQVNASAFQFGDATFAQQLCSAWNNSSLPQRLGEKGKKFGNVTGNGWIDHDTGYSSVSKGFQKIVSGRKECKGFSKLQLVIEKQEDGTAKCTSGGAYDGTKLTWQFLPNTYHWFNFAKSFGFFDFPKIMSGFKGPMWFAKQNQGNFQVFWRLGAKIGLSSDWQTGCSGLDVTETQREINEYKKKFNIN